MTLKLYASIIGAILGTIALITATWTFNPIAHAGQIEDNDSAIKKLEQRVTTSEQKSRLSGLVFDLKLAKSKKELGATDQDALINLLEQNLISLEKEVSNAK